MFFFIFIFFLFATERKKEDERIFFLTVFEMKDLNMLSIVWWQKVMEKKENLVTFLKLERVAPLITDHPCSKTTFFQGIPIWQPPLYIITIENF